MVVGLVEIWFFPLIGLVAQIIASVYLIKIHRRIGKQLTEIFTGFNVLAYCYLVFLFYGLYLATHVEEQTPLETFSIWFGLIYPVVNSIYHMRLKRFYKKGLESDNIRNDKRDSGRDTTRDAKRDIERDIDRDKSRDMHRDLYRDRDDDDHKPTAAAAAPPPP